MFPSLMSRDDFFHPFESVLDNILNQFESFGRNNLKQHSGYPRLDVISYGDTFVVEMAIPGVEPADVRVEIHPKEDRGADPVPASLHVSGKMSHEYANKEGCHYHVRELTRKAFHRSMYLPDNLMGDPEAVFKNGMLTLTWKKPQVVCQKPNVKVIPVKKESDALPSIEPLVSNRGD